MMCMGSFHSFQTTSFFKKKMKNLLLVSVCKCIKCQKDVWNEGKKIAFAEKCSKLLLQKLNKNQHKFIQEGRGGYSFDIIYTEDKLDMSDQFEEIKKHIQDISDQEKKCICFAITNNEYDLEYDDPRWIYFCQDDDPKLGYDILVTLGYNSFADQLKEDVAHEEIKSQFHLTKNQMKKMKNFHYLIDCAVEHGRRKGLAELDRYRKDCYTRSDRSLSPCKRRKKNSQQHHRSRSR